MSVKVNMLRKTAEYSIRLATRGCRNRPVYHIVVSPSSEENNKVNAIEELGVYDPLPNANNELLVSMHVDRFKYWISQDNVKITTAVAKLLGVCGILPVHPMSYVEARKNREPKETEKTEDE